jgi:hypothetical protein
VAAGWAIGPDRNKVSTYHDTFVRPPKALRDNDFVLHHATCGDPNG